MRSRLKPLTGYLAMPTCGKVQYHRMLLSPAMKMSCVMMFGLGFLLTPLNHSSRLVATLGAPTPSC